MGTGSVVPGELSRAHGGVLVMDEFLEFRRDALECLRQPLEEGVVRLQRARARAEIPSRFQLVATTNLCPCGNWLGQRLACRCEPGVKNTYLRKLSGPLLDRFALIVLVGQDEGEILSSRSPASECLRRLSELKDWPARLEHAKRQGVGDHVPSAVVFHSQAEKALSRSSRRVRASVWRVTQWLAALDGEKPAHYHENLAALLRANLELCVVSRAVPPLDRGLYSADRR